MPPAAAQRRHRLRHPGVSSEPEQFPVDRLATTPLLEVKGSQTATYPLIQRSPDSRGLCQPIVSFPSQQITTQSLDHLRHAAPAVAPGQLPDPLLERLQRLLRHPAPCLSIPGLPQGVAKELAAEHATLTQLRFASFAMTSLWEDLHLQECAHAGRT